LWAITYLYGVKEGIDNAAHIGGLAGGLIIGYCFVPGLRKPTNKRLNYAITGALAFIIIATCGLIYKNIPNDAGDYDAGMAIFSQNEQKAMEVYKLKNVPDAKVLASIKDGIYYWNEDIKLLARLDKLDVPEPIKLRDKKLLKYLQLRVKCFEAMYKCVSEHTDKYNEDIKYYNHQTQLVLDELK
jgi:rhomboid protease GluP